jgi:hypothetical protein
MVLPGLGPTVSVIDTTLLAAREHHSTFHQHPINTQISHPRLLRPPQKPQKHLYLAHFWSVLFHSSCVLRARSMCMGGWRQKDVPPPRFELGAKDRPEEISVIYYVI